MFNERLFVNCIIYIHMGIGLALVFAGGVDFATATTPTDTTYALNVSQFGYAVVLLSILERCLSGIAYRNTEEL